MISRFEPTAEDMLREGWNDRSVLPLHFKTIDHPLRRKTDSVDGYEADPNTTVVQLRGELAAMEAKLRAQSQIAATLMEEAKTEALSAASAEWELEMSNRISQERSSLAKACIDFARERTQYFAAVESEVVRLALAIAARVLHREATLDPLLLSGVVRVALDKVSEDTTVSLHVPESQALTWKEKLQAEDNGRVHVVGEERMDATECVLETSIGRVELGVVVQLEEIEKGFFDLLQQRPA